MSTEDKCYFLDEDYHDPGYKKGLKEIILDDEKCRRLVCKMCYGNHRTCALCGMFHCGNALELTSRPAIVIDFDVRDEDADHPERLDTESFCSECVNENLPEFMVRMFRDDFEALEEYFGEYHFFNCRDDVLDRFDCSNVNTIRVKYKKDYFDAKDTARFAWAMSQLALSFKGVNTFLRDVFIAELRQQKRDEKHPVQLAYDARIEEGLAALAHFIPASQGQSRTFELLPRRYIRSHELENHRYARKTSNISLSKIRETNDFNSFLDFLIGK